MDIPSLKKSFKSHGSKKLSRRISTGAVDEISQSEKLLSEHDHNGMRPSSSLGETADYREVIVKIDSFDHDDEEETKKASTSNTISRQPSYGGARKDEVVVVDDPPSRLIGQFLKKQKNAGGEMTLDVDLEMEELRRDRNSVNLSPVPESQVRVVHQNNQNYKSRVSMSKEVKVSFQSPTSDVNRRESSSSSDSDSDADLDYITRCPSNLSQKSGATAAVPAAAASGGGEVLKCTSFQRKATLLRRTKTQQSRLMDPPPEQIISVGGGCRGSGQLKSGILPRSSGVIGKLEKDIDEEDESIFDEDFPEDFNKAKLNALTIIQWISLISIVTALICTLLLSKWKRKKLRGLNLWKWELLVAVLICGRLVSGWWIRFVVLIIERNFLLRKRVLYFVYGIRSPVQNCIWLGLVLIAWHCMFDKTVQRDNEFLKFVNKLMICMLVATLLWLVKTLMVKVLASLFHVSKFFDRIQDALFNQYVIETLSGPPLIEIQNHQEDEERMMSELQKLQNAGATVPPELRANLNVPSTSKSGRMIGSGRIQRPIRDGVSGPVGVKTGDKDQAISIDHLHKLNPKNVSAWNMKRLMKIVRHGSLTTLDEEVHGMTQEDDSATQIRSELEAKIAARKIFLNVARPGSKSIYLGDLLRFLREEEALKTIALLCESPEDEKISRKDLKNWVVNAFIERRALALTLNDTKTAVNKLHQMVNVLVGIIILVLSLLILEIASRKVLLFISSQFIVLVFIFGNTCKTVFESLIFLFVMHPFDVGDRCEIDGIQMVVEEMNILSTIFLRYDNLKIAYPNSTLSTRPISNYYRSPDMGDSVDFSIHIATPADKIVVMKQRIINFVESKKDHWYPSPAVVVMNLEDLKMVKMSVWMRHRMNHQNMGEKWMRRALVVEEMVKIFKELDVEYRLHPIDINIRNMPPMINSTTRVPSTWTTASTQ